MKELIKITNEENFITERGTILSTNLVTIINEFRKVESETNEEKRFIELKHKSLMEKIRKEDETLKTLGLNGGQNFSPTSYKDIQIAIIKENSYITSVKKITEKKINY